MAQNEHLLHFIWKNRLFNPESLITENGTLIEVLDPGLQNEDAGPDFFNAKIKINNRVWAGNVEIHNSSSDWYRHGHNHDRIYNSVILHISEVINGVVINELGQEVPQCAIEVSDKLRSSADFLLHSKCRIPCKNFMSSISAFKLNAWLTVLSLERLERKTNDIYNHLKRYNNSWDDVFYVMLTRNFGFGINSDEFERLALSLPYKIILKHSDNLFQIEALMFGQAGLLDSDKGDDYYCNLQREYLFLKSKYKLKSPEGNQLKRLRVRPVSFPELRIAQLAALFGKTGRLFSAMLEKEDYSQMISHFIAKPSEYWQTHYSFRNISGKSNKVLGRSSLDIIIINTVVPILFAYGKKTGLEEHCDRSVQLLESIKPENNSTIREFVNAGVVPKNAMDSQSLIQLKKEYCDKRKCLYCRIGHQLLSKSR